MIFVLDFGMLCSESLTRHTSDTMKNMNEYEWEHSQTSHDLSLSMDLLQMDIHRRVNEFMHLSLSKVSQKHFRHAFPL